MGKCWACKTELSEVEAASNKCPSCGAKYPVLGGTMRFTPQFLSEERAAHPEEFPAALASWESAGVSAAAATADRGESESAHRESDESDPHAVETVHPLPSAPESMPQQTMAPQLPIHQPDAPALQSLEEDAAAETMIPHSGTQLPLPAAVDPAPDETTAPDENPEIHKTIDTGKMPPEEAKKWSSTFRYAADQLGAPAADSGQPHEMTLDVPSGAGTPGTWEVEEHSDTTMFGPEMRLVIQPREISQSREAPATDSAGESADRLDYELLEVIGRGGMGLVYSARQTSVDREVAVKMIWPDHAKDEVARENFLSEAVITGELDHPNIVPIHDVGKDRGNALFYSMKRVRGTPWQKVISTMSQSENLRVLMSVADAVAFAHSRGVVHRDLKPENGMLGDFGEVMVMDWGLALVTRAFGKAESVTRTAGAGCTP